jgi:hypothetical protein
VQFRQYGFLAVIVTVAACSTPSTGTEASTTPQTLAPLSESTTSTVRVDEGTAVDPTGTTRDEPLSTSPDRKDQTVELGAFPPSVTWGDAPVTVTATASSGLAVEFATTGGCSVDGSGRLSFSAVGTCTLAATQPGDSAWNPARASASIQVLRAKPSISFTERELTFVRGLRVPLWAESSPAIPITYRVVPSPDAFYDEACSVEGTDFVFDTEPEPTPAPAVCAVEASVPPSPDYDTPEPVTALVRVGVANWSVRLGSVETPLSYRSTDQGKLTLTIFEDSGSTYGMIASTDCAESGYASSDVPEDSGVIFVDPGYPSAPGTTTYTLTVVLRDPGTGSYECTLSASGAPLDHYGGQGSDTLTFEVVP